MEDAVLHWSVRLAVFCYGARVWTEMSMIHHDQSASLVRRARLWWTAGGVMFALHVICAFAFVHTWSHSQAYRYTANTTEAMIGLSWGGGLYFNYAFTFFWLADLAAWWLFDARFPYQSSRYFFALHAFFVFMVFQATVVFGPMGWKWMFCFVVIAGATKLYLVRYK